MADETKEQLRIEAELDTSKLPGQAKAGLTPLVTEEKRVETQAAQTSKAIDNIGNSLTKAGQTGTQALNKIGQEADKAAKKIASIDTSVRNIKLGQLFGVASRLAGTDLAKGLGNQIGNALGMGGETKGLAGAAITGALGGASMGAMAGPLVAAGAALAGAATGLIQASKELKQAATEQRQTAQSKYESLVRAQDEMKAGKAWHDRLAGFTEGLTSEDASIRAKNRKKILAEIAQYETENSGLQNEIDWNRYTTDATSLDIGAKYKGKAKQEKLAELFGNSANFIASSMGTIADHEAKIADLRRLLGIPEPKAQTAKETTQAAQKITLPDNSATIKSLQGMLSVADKMGNYKLSDSLTRIGGGFGGYGAQMSGVANNVSSIKSILTQMLAELRKADGANGVFVE